MIWKNLYHVKATGPIRQEGIQELLSSIPMFQGVGLNKQILNYGLKVQQRLCLKNDGESKKKSRVIVSYKDNKQLELI